MSDFAERVDDLICSFETITETTMDTLTMLIFGWILFGLFLLCIGRFIYEKCVLPREKMYSTHDRVHISSTGLSDHLTEQPRSKSLKHSSENHSSKEVHSAAAGLHAISKSAVLLGAGASASSVAAAVARSRTQATIISSEERGMKITSNSHSTTNLPYHELDHGNYKSTTLSSRKRLTKKNSGPPFTSVRNIKASLPQATGPDSEIVSWINKLIIWLHEDTKVKDELLEVWINSMNDFVAPAIGEVKY